MIYIAHMASFASGVTFGGVLLAYLVVYWLKDFDPQFVDVPSVAFQMEILGVVFQIVVGSIVFVLGLVVRRRLSGKKISVRYGYVSFIFGAVFPVLMYWASDVSFYPGLILIIGLPLLFAWLLSPCRRSATRSCIGIHG